MTELTITREESKLSLKHEVRIAVTDGPIYKIGLRVPEQVTYVTLEYRYDFEANLWSGSPTVVGRRVKKDGSHYAEAPQHMTIWHTDAGEEIRQFAKALWLKHKPRTKHTLTTAEENR